MNSVVCCKTPLVAYDKIGLGYDETTHTFRMGCLGKCKWCGQKYQWEEIYSFSGIDSTTFEPWEDDEND